MSPKVILALATLATLGLVCKGEESRVLFTNSGKRVPSDPDDIMKELEDPDRNFGNQEVFDLLSSLPGYYGISGFLARDYVERATFNIYNCLGGWDFTQYKNMIPWYIPDAMKNYVKFCHAELVKFCKSDSDRVIEEFFKSEDFGAIFVNNAKKHIDDVERVIRGETNPYVIANVRGDCWRSVYLIEHGLDHLDIEPKRVVDYLEVTTKLPIKKYVENCKTLKPAAF